jgi:hypothetical protein
MAGSATCGWEVLVGWERMQKQERAERQGENRRNWKCRCGQRGSKKIPNSRCGRLKVLEKLNFRSITVLDGDTISQ